MNQKKQIDSPDLLRRRLARGGALSSVVLGSLVSKPVLGATNIYNCTVSGKLSGNTSSHGNPIDCKTLGKSPGYYKNNNWPAGALKGTLPDNSCSWPTGSGLTKGTLFGGFTGGSATLADAFKRIVTGGKCEVVCPGMQGFSSSLYQATMLQVLYAPGGLNDTVITALGRATVASILNALAYGVNFPLTVEKVIQMFNAVYMGGTYQVNSSTYWDRDQVKTYFESLYG